MSGDIEKFSKKKLYDDEQGSSRGKKQKGLTAKKRHQLKDDFMTPYSESKIGVFETPVVAKIEKTQNEAEQQAALDFGKIQELLGKKLPEFGETETKEAKEYIERLEGKKFPDDFFEKITNKSLTLEKISEDLESKISLVEKYKIHKENENRLFGLLEMMEELKQGDKEAQGVEDDFKEHYAEDLAFLQKIKDAKFSPGFFKELTKYGITRENIGNAINALENKLKSFNNVSEQKADNTFKVGDIVTVTNKKGEPESGWEVVGFVYGKEQKIAFYNLKKDGQRKSVKPNELTLSQASAVEFNKAELKIEDAEADENKQASEVVNDNVAPVKEQKQQEKKDEEKNNSKEKPKLSLENLKKQARDLLIRGKTKRGKKVTPEIIANIMKEEGFLKQVGISYDDFLAELNKIQAEIDENLVPNEKQTKTTMSFEDLEQHAEEEYTLDKLLTAEEKQVIDDNEVLEEIIPFEQNEDPEIDENEQSELPEKTESLLKKMGTGLERFTNKMANAGAAIEENKAKVFKNTLAFLSRRSDYKWTPAVRGFFDKWSKIYAEREEREHNFRNNDNKTKTQKFLSTMKIAGNIGKTIGLAFFSSYKGLMMATMTATEAVGAAKEQRMSNERMRLDEKTAEKEAWTLYDKADIGNKLDETAVLDPKNPTDRRIIKELSNIDYICNYVISRIKDNDSLLEAQKNKEIKQALKERKEKRRKFLMKYRPDYYAAYETNNTESNAVIISSEEKNKKFEADKQALNEAYRKALPEFIKQRLLHGGKQDVNVLAKSWQYMLQTSVMWRMRWIDEKIKKYEDNKNFNETEKKKNIDDLLWWNDKFIKDMDKMIGGAGAIDTLAFSLKSAETAGKAASALFITQSLKRMGNFMAKIYEDPHILQHGWQYLTHQAVGGSVDNNVQNINKDAFDFPKESTGQGEFFDKEPEESIGSRDPKIFAHEQSSANKDEFPSNQEVNAAIVPEQQNQSIELNQPLVADKVEKHIDVSRIQGGRGLFGAAEEVVKQINADELNKLDVNSKEYKALVTYQADRIKDLLVDDITNNNGEKFGLENIKNPDNITKEQFAKIKWDEVRKVIKNDTIFNKTLSTSEVSSITNEPTNVSSAQPDVEQPKVTNENIPGITQEAAKISNAPASNSNEAPQLTSLTEFKDATEQPFTVSPEFTDVAGKTYLFSVDANKDGTVDNFVWIQEKNGKNYLIGEYSGTSDINTVSAKVQHQIAEMMQAVHNTGVKDPIEFMRETGLAYAETDKLEVIVQNGITEPKIAREVLAFQKNVIRADNNSFDLQTVAKHYRWIDNAKLNNEQKADIITLLEKSDNKIALKRLTGGYDEHNTIIRKSRSESYERLNVLYKNSRGFTDFNVSIPVDSEQSIRIIGSKGIKQIELSKLASVLREPEKYY